MLSNFPRSKTSGELGFKLNDFGLKTHALSPYIVCECTYMCLFLMVELIIVSDCTLSRGVVNANACIIKVVKIQNLEPTLKTGYVCLSFLVILCYLCDFHIQNFSS